MSVYKALPKQLILANAPTRLRLVSANEIGTIATLAERVSAGRWAHQGRGFVVGAYTASGYLEKMRNGWVFYLCELLDNDGSARVVGYIAGATSESLQRADSLSDYWKIVSTRARLLKTDRFFVLEQMAIDPDFQGKGLGKRFFDELSARVSRATFFRVIEAPLNYPHREFWQKRGFTRLDVFETPAESLSATLLGSQKLSWGIYYRKANGESFQAQTAA
jgi:GNAT superfamily N-acetyltransferase